MGRSGKKQVKRETFCGASGKKFVSKRRDQLRQPMFSWRHKRPGVRGKAFVLVGNGPQSTRFQDVLSLIRSNLTRGLEDGGREGKGERCPSGECCIYPQCEQSDCAYADRGVVRIPGGGGWGGKVAWESGEKPSYMKDRNNRWGRLGPLSERGKLGWQNLGSRNWGREERCSSTEAGGEWRLFNDLRR